MNMNCLNCGHSYSLPTGEPFKGRSVEIYDRLGGGVINVQPIQKKKTEYDE